MKKIRNKLEDKYHVDGEINIRRFSNGLGVFLFGGMALSNITNPLYSTAKTNEFLAFIAVAAMLYYFLVNTYFMTGIWKLLNKIVFCLIGVVSIIMIFIV